MANMLLLGKEAVLTVTPTRRFESQERPGHRVTVHFGPEGSDATEPVLDMTLFIAPGDLDWLKVGKPVRIVLEPVEEG